MLRFPEYISVMPVDTKVLIKGLRSSYKHLEELLQIHCAMTVENISCIVTRYVKEFKGSGAAVPTPDIICATP